MIIYNVTINIEEGIHQEWLQWMQKVHVPRVMATGYFTDYKILKLLSREHDEEGVTYAIQYTAASMADYDDYQVKHAPALQAETQALYGGKFAAFRTLLEVVL